MFYEGKPFLKSHQNLFIQSIKPSSNSQPTPSLYNIITALSVLVKLQSITSFASLVPLSSSSIKPFNWTLLLLNRTLPLSSFAIPNKFHNGSPDLKPNSSVVIMVFSSLIDHSEAIQSIQLVVMSLFLSLIKFHIKRFWLIWVLCGGLVGGWFLWCWRVFWLMLR